MGEGEGEGKDRPDRGWSDRVINIQSTPGRANNFLPSSYLTDSACSARRERGEIFRIPGVTLSPRGKYSPADAFPRGGRQKEKRGMTERKRGRYLLPTAQGEGHLASRLSNRHAADNNCVLTP